MQPLSICDIFDCWRYKGILVCEQHAVRNCDKAYEIANAEKCFIEVSWIDPNDHHFYIVCSDRDKITGLTINDLITMSKEIWNEEPARLEISLVIPDQEDH